MDQEVDPRARQAADGRVARERALASLVKGLVDELHRQRASAVEVFPSSRLEQDLGVDSLARTELILRIERAFRVRLPVKAAGEAETVADLFEALERASAGKGATAAQPAAAPLPPVSAAAEARTLIDVLEWHVARHPERLHLTLLQDEATALGALSYAELQARARRAAAGLIARDIAPGDRIALMLPTSLEFFEAFFGILYAGAIPAPIYPPMRLSQLEDHLRRQAGILRNAGARMLVTAPEGLRLARLLRGQVETLEHVESVAGLTSGASGGTAFPRMDERATALIQYTSGSTGDPKGVVLSHANLLANVRAMGRAMEASSADVFVSWLPLYHDMGLIGAWLGCLYFGAPLYVMSPLSFLVRPETWLWAIHRFRATLSASPNFGFELCLNKIEDANIEGLDLSSLRMAANGAEPVSVQTLRRFTERFARRGLRPEAVAPVYGLAECSVGLAFPPPGRLPVIDRIDRDALAGKRVAAPAQANDPKPLELAGCGRPLPGHEIRIVDELGRETGERREGRLEFRGPSATAGYFRNEAKTRELFHDGWLDSGDRAYAAGGEIFITGRIKDIIIRAGRHLHPQEIEEVVAGVSGVRKGCVAVFGAADPRSGTERVIVVAETAVTDAAERAALESRVREAASQVAGAPPDDVALAPPRSVPKTSSGKIRRSAAKELYLTGAIGAPSRALWRQIARLALAGLAPRLRRLAGLAFEAAYAFWWWLVIGLGYVFAWLAVMSLPGLGRRWAAVRGIARMMLAMARVPVRAAGIERIPAGGAVLVFNHSSYTDAVLLAATLPGEPAFVAKRELARQIFAGSFLRRLGTLFVERFDLAGSLADAQAIVAAARSGRNIVFFPEGTFSRRPGLSGFYLGAFKAAAEAGLAVVPGALRGTRTMLRADQWFPRWSALSVTIEEAITPKGSDFAAILELRDAARAAVLAHCGEPDLEELAKPPPIQH